MHLRTIDRDDGARWKVARLDAIHESLEDLCRGEYGRA
jgi:hypothetical protein